jgi:hypothetical protein
VDRIYRRQPGVARQVLPLHPVQSSLEANPAAVDRHPLTIAALAAVAVDRLAAGAEQDAAQREPLMRAFNALDPPLVRLAASGQPRLRGLPQHQRHRGLLEDLDPDDLVIRTRDGLAARLASVLTADLRATPLLRRVDQPAGVQRVPQPLADDGLSAPRLLADGVDALAR